ncbi:rod shape-determining protein RodA [Candidatus Dependentiae bacterium]|nr:rod shape-determining protein RodA [Candidatus Dependentiae bacterium]
MIDRRYFRYFDWISFCITIILLIIGLLFIFSSTYNSEKMFSIFFKKQFFGVVSGIFIYLYFCIKDLKRFDRLGYLFYFVILFLLTYSLFVSVLTMGAKRWISLYFFKFQPSELSKLFLPIFIAYYFSENNLNDYKFVTQQIPFKKFFFPISILLISFVLIGKQPDLGTALVILFTGLILLWFIGINKKFFFISMILMTIFSPFLWSILKPYQKQRILVLLGQGDIKKERYQLEQSKIAIGSGALTGKGFMQGTQNKLAFLPENHNDFIFSVICEEWGFVGAIFVLLLFCILFIRISFIIFQLNSFFEQIIAVGLISHFMLSVCINIGMVVGILPIVGIPLPLISYGITHLWINLASLGWLNNIAIRRFYY